LNTKLTRIFFAGADGCLSFQDYYASSYAEAVQCAKKQHANVLESPPDLFPFGKTCEGSCDKVYVWGKDSSQAKDCAEKSNPGCTITDGGC
jgi:hypothetical protein